MILNVFKNTVLLFVLILISCGSNVEKKSAKDSEILNQIQDDKNIVVGANLIEKYLPLLNEKKVGIVANQTSVIFKDNDKQITTTYSKSSNDVYTHLVDSLLSLNIDIKTVVCHPSMALEEIADAGERYY